MLQHAKLKGTVSEGELRMHAYEHAKGNALQVLEGGPQLQVFGDRLSDDFSTVIRDAVASKPTKKV